MESPWPLKTLLLMAIVAAWVSMSTQQSQPINLFARPRAVASLCNCVCGRTGSARAKRLTGGQNVARGRYPWLATIYRTGIPSVITGALISSRHVLTSMTPFSGLPPNNITVGLDNVNRCTSTGTGLNMTVNDVNAPSQYDAATGAGDIAILRLTSPVVFSERTRPVCLPPFSTSSYQYQVASVLSWGSNGSANSVSPCIVREIQQAVLPPSICRTSGISDRITSDKGCVGTQGVPSIMCSADAGALVQVQVPNTQYIQLIGIVPSTNNCSVNGPSLFTRVMPYLTWILENSADSCYCRA